MPEQETMAGRDQERNSGKHLTFALAEEEYGKVNDLVGVGKSFAAGPFESNQ